MTFVVTRTSNATPEIKTFNTVQDIVNFYKDEGEIIFKENFWYNEPISDCLRCCHVDKKIAAKIVQIKYELEIYDDYRE